MFSISKDFAPPLKLISPYFKIGVTFYLLAMMFLLFIKPTFFYKDMIIAGWIHLFLLGFVMIIIFGAMAQLIPVVLEVGHAIVWLYYIILPLISVGTVIMVFGFWIKFDLLPLGGLLVLVSMIIFTLEALMTLKKAKTKTLTTKTVAISNSFLLIGILSGFIIALGLNGAIDIDIDSLLNAHIYAVLGGFVFLTIMGFSLILIPMFSLAHGFSQTFIKLGFGMVVSGVGLVLVSTIIKEDIVRFIGYITTLIGVVFYIYQMYLIYKLTVRKEMDVWAKSMLFGFFSLIVSVIFAIISLTIQTNETYLHISLWFFIVGFIGFLINGHLYKIIPFLVWFEYFSPLVGKQKVPMLHQMYPKKESSIMFLASLAGTIIVAISLFNKIDYLFKIGVFLLIIGAIFLHISVFKMLANKVLPQQYKENNV